MSGQPLAPLRVVGFDVRRTGPLVAELLMPEERRAAALLAPDCPEVLSADRSIWPSLFHLESGEAPWPVSFPDLIPVASSPATRYFEAFELWPTVASLRAAYRPSQEGDCGIALALLLPQHYGGQFRNDPWFQAATTPGANPATPASDWPFLGFDVVNSGLQSALAGFGPRDDMGEVRAAWGGDMNAFHLFEDLPRTLDYCAEANERLATDGPFYVAALFLFWDTLGEIAPRARSLRNAGAATPA